MHVLTLQPPTVCIGRLVRLPAPAEGMMLWDAFLLGSRNAAETRRAREREPMTGYIQTIITAVAGHQTLVYGLVGLLALAESLPMVGAIVPGTALIVGLSVLAPSGALGVWPLLTAATLGAIAGDGLSYWFGYRYRQTLTAVWPFTRYPHLLARGEAFFQQHGGKSVFLARFTPGVRAVMPLVAGMTAMPVGHFYRVNILSALIWAPSHVLPGLLVGATVALTGAIALRLAALLGLTLATLIGFRGLRLQALFEKHNSFLRPLKKKGFKEARVRAIGWYDLGKSHDSGIQQEPS